jgi:hypothetical protein
LLFSRGMVATRAGKRAAVDASIPLSDAGILKQVLSYSGAGEFIFYAPISKLWLACYKAVPAYQLKRPLMIEGEVCIEVLPHMTLRRAVFASAARVTLAYELGLRFDTDNAESQFYTGSELACKPVLAEAHRLGMPFSSTLLNGAASAGELCTVIWLYTEHACAITRLTTICSAKGGQIEVLRWLQQQGVAFEGETMFAAAKFGHDVTCAYLHSEGCPWHQFAAFAAASANHWSTVRWLHEHGCPWQFEQVCRLAAQAGDVTAITYLLQQQTAPSHLQKFMLDTAGEFGQLAAAQW